MKIAQQMAAMNRPKNSNLSWVEFDDASSIHGKFSLESSQLNVNRKGGRYAKNPKAGGGGGARSKLSDSVSSSIGSNLNKAMQVRSAS